MIIRFLVFLSVLLALALASPDAEAQQIPSQPALRIGIHISPPFVMKDSSNQPQGMAIDLWRYIAQRAGYAYDYKTYPTVAELLSATETGEVDVAVSNLTITHERALRVDFTQPWYDGGLRIMVDNASAPNTMDTLKGLHSMGHLRNYALLGLAMIVATLLLTLFDRRFDIDFPKHWGHGFSESFYHVISIVTSGKTSRKNLFGPMGKLFSAFWIVCGVGIVAYVTSSITSVMTADAMTQQIDGISDLGDRTVAVFSGSVAETFAHEAGLRVKSYDDIDQAAAALKREEATAILADAPVLEYYAHNHADLTLSVVGNLIHPDKYAFALHSNSPLRRSMTQEILRAKELGTLSSLKAKYFGNQP